MSPLLVIRAGLSEIPFCWLQIEEAWAPPFPLRFPSQIFEDPSEGLTEQVMGVLPQLAQAVLYHRLRILLPYVCSAVTACSTKIQLQKAFTDFKSISHSRRGLMEFSGYRLFYAR